LSGGREPFLRRNSGMRHRPDRAGPPVSGRPKLHLTWTSASRDALIRELISKGRLMSTTATTPKMLNIKQVARDLSVSTKTVRRMIDRQELRHHRLGRAIRISLEDLRALLNSTRS
jgi:excisionase family DNA binding protein